MLMVLIFSGSVHTVTKNSEFSEVSSKEIGLEEKTEKTRYMVISRDRHPRQNHDIKIGNKLFERVKGLKVKIFF